MPPERIYQGTGPGPITPDGCAVDYYAMLTPDGEPEIVHAAIPEGAAILELGAGAGRITRALLALGHEVVAVDESPEMLAHINGAETVLSRIQDLSLARMFDVVLLMSYVIDTADDDLCRAFLRTCRRHVAPDGCVILQRQPPEWYDTVEPSERRRDGRVIRMRDVSRPEPDLLAATMEYVVGDRRWTHTYVSRRRTDARFEELLCEAGLTMEGFLHGDRRWVRAVAA
ncbi:class I SAM-dependent methyltransferase [Microbispora hainanensis]|uniref:Class I SAM-dependent methyltransferase n=1 Tax=Microbispora hainanensis TaxID=568844 RepID=A0ABZ1SZG7_9ACTN|nr:MULTISPECIES: methyltransferase domain-containing protein [Microbispora]NJP23504.1 methyltransferase domain-containing protein [Microbispora sp. CL1-1]TQS15738.1 methyltransferase domain-containing protein [Microbispora sp. SCL1-1]